MLLALTNVIYKIMVDG